MIANNDNTPNNNKTIHNNNNNNNNNNSNSNITLNTPINLDKAVKPVFLQGLKQLTGSASIPLFSSFLEYLLLHHSCSSTTTSTSTRTNSDSNNKRKRMDDSDSDDDGDEDEELWKEIIKHYKVNTYIYSKY